MFFVVYKFVLHERQITCQTDKGNKLKHAKFSQGVPVWRMLSPNVHCFYSFPQFMRNPVVVIHYLKLHAMSSKLINQCFFMSSQVKPDILLVNVQSVQGLMWGRQPCLGASRLFDCNKLKDKNKLSPFLVGHPDRVPMHPMEYFMQPTFLGAKYC